jgi:hypothetical protein
MRALACVTVAVAVAAAAGAGCGGGPPLLGATGPRPVTRAELLAATGEAVWRGDLPSANLTLAQLADREQRVADPALDFWSELVALLRCEPLARMPRSAPVPRDAWDELRRLVQIERVRLARRGGGGMPPVAFPSGAGAPGGSVIWPLEQEHWSDELPLPAAVSRCAPAGTVAAVPATAPRAAGSSELELVASTAAGLPAGHPAAPLLLLEAAVLGIARGEGARASALLRRLEAAAPTLPAAERAEVPLAFALAALDDPASSADLLLARGRAALAGDLPPGRRRALQLLLSQRLTAAGRSEDATALLGPPPHGDDRVGRYIAFRQVEAHAKANRRAELLAEAREALHGKARAAVDADPALTAVMDLALRTLLASPVSAETLELLEALGPPHERLARAEMFAQLALESGGLSSAMTTFLWLYENDSDPARQLQHLARASVAAARAGDRREFARTFRMLAGQDEHEDKDGKDGKDGKDAKDGKDGKGTLGAPPRPGEFIASAEADRAHAKRRETRSVNWQRALLVVARDALPALVDSDDQADLGTLVDTLKRHLGDGGRGPVDEELTTLYRAASAHLKSGPRAYAETVGAQRRPILLGDVLVGRKYEVTAPEVDLDGVLAEVGPLVFVPRTGGDPALASLRRWPGRLGVTWTGGGS